MEKLSKRFTNLNKVSKNILKYGLFLVLIFLIISNFLLKNVNTIEELNIAREFVCSNVYAFCEIIIGAIMIDMFMEKNDQWWSFFLWKKSWIINEFEWKNSWQGEFNIIH